MEGQVIVPQSVTIPAGSISGTFTTTRAPETPFPRWVFIQGSYGTSGGLVLWNVVDNIARPTSRIEFLEMTAGAEQLAKWITIGVAKVGGGMYLLRGKLSPDIQCRLGVIPAIKADTEIEFVIDTPVA